MKTKFFSLLVFFCLQMSISAYGDVIFRKATEEDLDAILRVYRSYSEEDRQYLVTFPNDVDKTTMEAVDKTVLRGELKKNKIFLSENDENHEILGILKLFLVKESDVLDILQDELRAVGDQKKQILAESYDSRLSNKRDLFFQSVMSLSSFSNQSQFELNPKRQLFIYYGGAYSVPDQRGNGLHTQLLSKALEEIQSELITRLQSQPFKKQVIFTYGQVEANTKNKGMIHVFTSFTKSVVKHMAQDSQDSKHDSKRKLIMSGPVYHLGYRAYKPSFTFNKFDQKLEITFPDEGKGMGNLLIFRMRRR